MQRSPFTDQENSHKRTCPVCGTNQTYVLESRNATIKGSGEFCRRRRLECHYCKHRSTTKEVDSDFLDYLLITEKRLTAFISGITNQNGWSAMATKHTIACNDCQHEGTNGCAIGIPEFRTAEAEDCSAFSPATPTN
jgi:DNA-directed RNA polymerase subunit RPC12/RpoP